jgi:hypothetical protein
MTVTLVIVEIAVSHTEQESEASRIRREARLVQTIERQPTVLSVTRIDQPIGQGVGW